MDRKTISILVVCGALLFMWPILVNRILPPKPAPPHTNIVSTASSTNQVAQGTNQTNQSSFVAGTNVVAQFVVNTNQPEETLVITNANARYTFSSHGGGIKTVELLSTRRPSVLSGEEFSGPTALQPLIARLLLRSWRFSEMRRS